MLLGRPRVALTAHPVQVDAQVEELLPLLRPLQTEGVRILSLCGMGGIGKSTLACALFNRLSPGTFQRCIFFEAGKDLTTGQPLLDLQRKLLDQLTEGGPPQSRSASAVQQQQQLQNCTGGAGRLLLVIDDLWSAEQRDKLLCRNQLQPGSCVILTGRSSNDLLPGLHDGSCSLRRVQLLESEAAKQLLCWHAFGQPDAPSAYVEAVSTALTVCGGLPLALKVVGSAISSWDPDASKVSPQPRQGIAPCFQGHMSCLIVSLEWTESLACALSHFHCCLMLKHELLARHHRI